MRSVKVAGGRRDDYEIRTCWPVMPMTTMSLDIVHGFGQVTWIRWSIRWLKCWPLEIVSGYSGTNSECRAWKHRVSCARKLIATFGFRHDLQDRRPEEMHFKVSYNGNITNSTS